MRRIKHWFRHEWKEDGFRAYWGSYIRIETHLCAYPECTARSLFDTLDRFRFGTRAS